MQTIQDTIVRRIRAKRRGWVFTPKDLLDIGNRDAVDKVLSRLVHKSIIRRISRGIYDFPKQNKLIGTLSPSTDNVARAMAIKSGDKAFPSGAMSANLLGLSTQVPAKPIYLTNGSSKNRIIGNQTIRLQHAHVPLLDKVPDVINLTIQALAYIGQTNIDDTIIYKCTNILSANDISTLLGNAKYLPSWLLDIVHIIKQVKDGKVSKTA